MSDYLVFPDIQQPSFPIEISYEDIAIRSKKESGDYKLRKRMSYARKTFTVKWNAMSHEDYQKLENFYINDCYTNVKEFIWTYPTVIYKNLPSDIFNGKEFHVRFLSLDAKATEHSYFVVDMVIMESLPVDITFGDSEVLEYGKFIDFYVVSLYRNLYDYEFVNVDVMRNIIIHLFFDVDVIIVVSSGGSLLYEYQVPVLGDDVRGYINRNGEYNTSKTVPQADWLVNNYTVLNSGSEKFNGQLIIDVEIDNKDNLFVVTDGFYRDCHCVEYNNHLWRVYTITMQYLESDGSTTVVPYHEFIHHIEPIVGCQYVLGVKDSHNINQPIIIYKNGEKIDEINLQNYILDVEEECWNCESELMSQNPDISNAINFTKQPAPPSDSFIAFSYARVSSFRMHTNGDWDAIIETGAYGYCFMYFLYDGSIFDGKHLFDIDNANMYDLKSMHSTLNYLDVLIMQGHYLTEYSGDLDFVPYNSHPYYNGVRYNKVDLPSYESILDEYLYYKDELKFKFYTWEPVIFSASVVFHVHNGEIVEKIQVNSGGGTTIRNQGWDESECYYDNIIQNNDQSVIGIGVGNKSGLLHVNTSQRLMQDSNGNYTCRLSKVWSYPLNDNVKLFGKGAVIEGLCFTKDSVGDEIDPSSVIVNFSNVGLKDSYEIICSPYYPIPLFVYNDTTILPLTSVFHSDINVFLYQENSQALSECISSHTFNWTDYYQVPEDIRMYFPVWLHLSRNSPDGFYRGGVDCTIINYENRFVVYGLRGDFICYVYDGQTHYLSDNMKNFRFRRYFPDN